MSHFANKYPLIFSTLLMAISATAYPAKDRKSQNYQLATSDCTLEIQANPNGRVIVDSPQRNFSLFSEKSDASGWSLTFNFQCIKEKAENYCPTEWASHVMEHDPIVLKRVAVRRYDFQHPHYYSLVYASSFNNSDPPRPRDLYFCLGNESRTVVGRVPIGDEKIQFPTQALKIINTLVIHPTINGQIHP